MLSITHGGTMTDTSEVQLAKLEAEHKKRMEALKEVEAQLAAIRAANRDAKLIEIKKQIADYGFTAVDVFGAITAQSKSKKAPKGVTSTTSKQPNSSSIALGKTVLATMRSSESK